jgi:alpha,alpha-trehalose phosphorylase
MISHPAFPAEPWVVRETTLDLDVLAQSESVFALSNGHIGLRANLDEGEPHGLPGSYLNSVHEIRPLPYGEAGYGDPQSSQTIVNVTNGKLIRLLIDDEPFDVRYGTLHSHERVLDMRAGVLHRNVTWTSPAGRTVEVRSTRLVSFAERAVAAIFYEVRPVNGGAQVVLQSDLVANEPLPMVSGDPRASAVLVAPFDSELHGAADMRGILVHRTKRSKLRVGVGMDHLVDAPQGFAVEMEAHADLARMAVTTNLDAGQSLRVVKFLGYGWSAERTLPAVEAQVEAALTAAKATGWDRLLAAQRAFLDEFWAQADVEIEGDDQVQQAVRFGLFHVLQASARAERRGIPAKGLTGPGYDGHSFWDTETFVLPVLTYTLPYAAADALRWRHDTLPAARDRAGQLGLKGSAFAWRTITGPECSAYWPAGAAAFHVNADVAYAMIRHIEVTGDQGLEHEIGVNLLASSARMWMSLGSLGETGQFRIDGVTGPDEYSAVADNNIYTNLMAQWNLIGAADAAERHPERAEEFEITGAEIASWRAAAAGMIVPYDDEAGVHSQAERFTAHEVWDFDGTPADAYPLLLHYTYRELYSKQVVKQADLVLAMHLRSDAFTPEQKARNFAYYEALTVRDSSLSASTQAIIAAEVGHVDLAYDYLGEAALIDLDDLAHNTRDGVHIASLAGSWIALVAGFGGVRNLGGVLSLEPKLPPSLTRLTFGIHWQGQCVRVTVTPEQAAYDLDPGEPIEVLHYGEKVQVHAGQTETRPIPVRSPGPRPEQPAGRAPARRG